MPFLLRCIGSAKFISTEPVYRRAKQLGEVNLVLHFWLFDVPLPVRYGLPRNFKTVGEVFLGHAVLSSFDGDVVSKAHVYHLLTQLLYISVADLPTNHSLLLRNLKLHFSLL